MSNDSNPLAWKIAAETAAAFVKHIADVTPCYMAGSLRRLKATVNDIEIVTRPESRTLLRARLDTLIRDGICEAADYGDGTQRQGHKYAGLLFQGARIEIFSPTPENFGYIYWLRTGPAKGNEFVMKGLGNWPIRFDDGSAWYTTYINGLKQLQYRLRVPDEETMFKLLGLAVIRPEHRSEAAYARVWKRRPVPPLAWIETLKIEQPKQASLF